MYAYELGIVYVHIKYKSDKSSNDVRTHIAHVIMHRNPFCDSTFQ